ASPRGKEDGSASFSISLLSTLVSGFRYRSSRISGGSYRWAIRICMDWFIERRFLCCGGSSFQRSRGRLTFPGRSTTGFSHRVLLVSQSYVAITVLTGHFPAKPPGRLEFATRCEVGEFHLGHYQTGMSTAININLDHQISPV